MEKYVGYDNLTTFKAEADKVYATKAEVVNTTVTDTYSATGTDATSGKAVAEALGTINDATLTFTNKTIDADNNTITNIGADELKTQSADDEGKAFVVQDDGTWALESITDAEAVQDVDALPETGETNVLYRLKDSISYGDSSTVTVYKLFSYDGSAYQGLSTVELTYEQYQGLTDDQLKDGTTYVVNGAMAVPVSISYNSWSDLPTLNGVTMQGNISLKDIGVYSKTQVDLLLEGKTQMLLVDEMPTDKEKNTFYYSLKDTDGNTNADGKRFIYVVDSEGTVAYSGMTGDVELTEYFKTANILTASTSSATDQQVYSAKYVENGLLKLSGGTMTGSIKSGSSALTCKNDSSYITVFGGTTYNKGSMLKLYGMTNTSTPTFQGAFQVEASNGNVATTMNGYPNGELSWGNNDISGNVKEVALTRASSIDTMDLRAYKIGKFVTIIGVFKLSSVTAANETLFTVTNASDRPIGIYKFVTLLNNNDMKQMQINTAGAISTQIALNADVWQFVDISYVTA